MGFGLLFLGYLFAYLLSLSGTFTAQYGALAGLIGTVVMMYAMTKLSEYEARFKAAFFMLLPLLASTLYGSVVVVLTLFGASIPSVMAEGGSLAIFAEYFDYAADFVFHAALFYAIYKIAGDTEVVGIKRFSVFSALSYAIFFLLQPIYDIFESSENAQAARIVFVCQFGFWLLCLALTTILLFWCYMKICDENDSEMEAKPSRFAFVNKFREAFERREEKARRRSLEYNQSKRNGKNGKKKRKKRK